MFVCSYLTKIDILIMISYEGNPVQEIISLQLKKPKNWNWEICTSKSSTLIALPVIQLFNAKGNLLAQSESGQTARRNKIIRPRRSKSDGCFQNFNTNSNSKEFKTRLPTCGEGNKRQPPCYVKENRNSLVSIHPSNTVEIETLEKPTKYKLRQSRAGILVVADESFSEKHQKRCHGRSRRCSAEDESRSNSLKYLNPLRKNEPLWMKNPAQELISGLLSVLQLLHKNLH
ncbi:unnamed protein product [Ceutorhynchus assimilis]|uniref:Uncharacterized protein n=1 Tax=Ceutorhynchus assimilis TaxID=467358 RepID=A0A9N9QLV0_9CUCU|nr:unnamed protein product [Ceutorhynchus assimilis]